MGRAEICLLMADVRRCFASHGHLQHLFCSQRQHPSWTEGQLLIEISQAWRSHSAWSTQTPHHHTLNFKFHGSLAASLHSNAFREMEHIPSQTFLGWCWVFFETCLLLAWRIAWEIHWANIGSVSHASMIEINNGVVLIRKGNRDTSDHFSNNMQIFRYGLNLHTLAGKNSHLLSTSLCSCGGLSTWTQTTQSQQTRTD